MARKQPTPPAPKVKMMVASSAKVAAGRRIARTPNAEWQQEAWRLFDSMGELRFAASWIANSASRVNLALGRVGQGGSDPVPIRETPEMPLTDLEADALQIVSELGGGPALLPEMMQHLATLIAVSGLGWILIEEDIYTPTGWKWTARSNDEVRDSGNGWEVQAGLEDGEEWDTVGWRPVAKNHVMLKVWKRHPRHADIPDSPVRAVIPVLKQLEGIDSHVNATSNSRLAGAGILFSPSEVEYQAPDVEGDANDPDEDISYANVDGLLDDLIENARLAAADPNDPAAVIPLPIEVPAEFISTFRHMTFWTEYSEQVIELSDRAVKRFALGMDMPPESVTGMTDASHWAAWRVAEEGVTIHIAPLVRVITTALTINWLHVNLLALGHDAAEVIKLVVFGDTTSLLVRPDKSADAISGYQELEVSGDAMRRESGLSPDDKPSQSEFLRRVLMRAMDRNPELSSLLLPVICQDIITPDDVKGLDWSQVSAEQQNFGVRSMDGEQSIRRSTDQAGQSQPTPVRTTTDSPLAASATSAALVASMDGVVHRALERAGNRLRSEVGRGVPGGNEAIASMDSAMIHTVIKPKRVAPLVAGAFDRVPELAERFDMDGPSLTAAVDGYTRHLLETSEPHSIELLTGWLMGAKL
jgi:hypothetical protein